MSYTVLARRYRSATFDDVVGQEHIAQTLKKAISSGRIAHAYLFCGTRGTGKTSTARILAKALNCESADGPTPTPCLKCESCNAIARGDDIDVIEIDAASNTGVDNVRDIIANASFMPARSRSKIYIIDEVHMLSKQAFNALLKTMEEPPAHVKFILATTEPEKVLPTILSRCQRYDFRNIPTREIAGHLKNICKQEKIKADDDALLLIAKAGAGSMRDSLSLLDRLLSIGEKELTIDLIESLLGLPKSQLIFDLAQQVGQGQVKAVLTQTDKLISSGLSTDTLMASLLEHLRNLLILRTCGPDCEMVEVPGLNPKDLNAQAQQFDPVALAQDIAILEELRRNMRTSQAGRAMLDAALVRLTLSDQFRSIADLLTSDGQAAPRTAPAPVKKKYVEPVTPTAPEAATPFVDRPVLQPSTLSRGAPAPLTPSPGTPLSLTPSPGTPGEGRDEGSPSTTVGAGSPEPAPKPIAVAEDEDDLPAPGKVWESSGPSLKELLAAQASKSQPATPAPAPVIADDAPNVEPLTNDDLPRVWQALLDLIAERGPALHSLVSQGKLVAINDGKAVIRYTKQHETFVKLLDRNGKKDVVRDALTKVMGQSLGVAFEVSQEASDSEPQTATLAPPAPSRPAPVARPQPKPVQRDLQLPPEPAANLIKPTPELIESLRTSEPLIKDLMDGFGATIVKIEEA
ncbi:MAG TPA: DNA polymerase III subunit gamma/tau [Tepidisphaeraceae bacterium]|jgi:DNA polymerase-3 subunit gamma/tau